jgi:hypothetical protein
VIVLPLAFDRWPNVEHLSDAARRLYVADELRRLDGIGAPLLTVALAQADDAVRHLALSLLRVNDDGEGKPIYPYGRQWMLRLVEGEAPPDRDAQGRAMPAALKGKVLRTKVGNLGGNLGPETDARETEKWGGRNRLARERQGGDLYVYRDVTRQPTPFTFEDASLILARWGIGVSVRQYDRGAGWKPGGEGEAQRGQCRWLVEELAPKPAAKAA